MRKRLKLEEEYSHCFTGNVDYAIVEDFGLDHLVDNGENFQFPPVRLHIRIAPKKADHRLRHTSPQRKERENSARNGQQCH